MNVLLVGNYPPDRQESMRRYTELLASGLRGHGHEVAVTAPSPIFGRLPVRSAAIRKWLGYIDKFLLFPLRLRRMARAFDLVHICDHSNAMYLRAVVDRPCVITCHDLLAIRSARGHFKENPVSSTGRVLQRVIARALTGASCILCVSEKTQQDLHTVLGIAPERTQVIPLPLEPAFRPLHEAERSPLLCAMGIPAGQPFFLHVGGNHWYKNRFALLPIFQQLRSYPAYRHAKLVMAGHAWPAEFHRYLAERNLAAHAIAIMDATDEQLCALYSAAEAFLFPSREEGFGWPILEAQACGCPVAVMNRPPMNSVAGEGGIWIDPADPAGAAAVIVKALENRDTWSAAGIHNLQRFQNGRVTEAYLDAYRSVSVQSTVEYA